MATPALKVMRKISNVEPTRKDTVLLVTFESGEQARINRNMAEFFPGCIYLPEWLDKKIFSKK